MSRSTLTHWALFSAPLIIMLAVIWFGFATETDVALFFKDHRTAHPAMKTGMKILTDWSNPIFYVGYAVTLFLAWRKGNKERVRFILILLVAQAVVAGLCVHFLKQTIGRPRPGQGEWFDPLTTRGSQHSLPSGHTTEIIGWTLPLMLRQRKFWLTGLVSLFIGAVAFSRIYLGWHHPSDVFFAWILGSFGGFATTILVESTLFKVKQ